MVCLQQANDHCHQTPQIEDWTQQSFLSMKYYRHPKMLNASFQTAPKRQKIAKKPENKAISSINS
jgi:hypothetical protein